MPRYVPCGPIEAHKTDDGEEYVLLAGGNGFLGVLDAALFERVFRLDGPAAAPQNGKPVDGPAHPVPGVPHTPADEIPAAERMAEALRARTQPGGPVGMTLPIGSQEAELAIAETRRRMEQATEERERGVNVTDTGKIPYGTKLKPGEGAGRGRKVCRRDGCHVVNPILADKCLGCGKKFKAD